MRRLLIGPIAAIGAFLCCAEGLPQAHHDGLRKIEVRRFGITAYAPVAWNLVGWAQDDRAFELRLPQEERSAIGCVSCELSIAGATLAEIQQRLDATDKENLQSSDRKRKLTLNRIESVDAKRFGAERARKWGRRLDSLWECSLADGQTSYELATRFIVGEMLYTFDLRTDQAHFDAYRADFEEMLAGAVIDPPETGLERLAAGLWMQRDYRFALRLPPDWQPAFGASDKVLFYARGKARETVSDTLTVMASQAQPLDFDKLRSRLTREIGQRDPKAEIAGRIVNQGTESALEMVVRTRRDGADITTLERRFCGPRRNYEVRFRLESSEFKRLEPELRKALDSFVEVAEPPRKDAA